MRQDEYDIGAAFSAIEEELIASMMRNMARHRAEETKEGIQWAMWQVQQLKALERYKRENQKRYRGKFQILNREMKELIRKARETGGMEQEKRILQAIRRGFKGYGKNRSAAHQAATAEFFKMNDRKLEALIEAVTHDMEKAETAVLRMAEDQYRKIIFNAQVYANTGAGTYEQAVDMASRNFLAAGLNCIEYANGARHTISDYADMAIRTASKRAYLQGEGEKRQEWGISTVIMNKRGNPCPKCLPFVGKVLIDDVWSGGRKDGLDPNTGKRYPLMSKAIEYGLYHPRCKDSHTTYFPGISTADDTWTKEELKAIEQDYAREQKKHYAKRQEEKYGRLAEYSLDEGNKKRYTAKEKQWEEVAESLNSGIMGLSQDELSALYQYKSFESYPINEALRNAKDMSDLLPAQQQFVKRLDSALSKIPKYEGDLIRTVNFSDWPDCDKRTNDFAKEFVPGKNIQIRQYWSTSKREGYDEEAGIKIYIQNAQNGRDISSVGLDEAEVLYERNRKFLVADKAFFDGKWCILLEEI
ncbi:UNVERIFIED_ORG: hypothetical protein B5F06_10175 [Lacrimispora saccharolytica]